MQIREFILFIQKEWYNNFLLPLNERLIGKWRAGSDAAHKNPSFTQCSHTRIEFILTSSSMLKHPSGRQNVAGTRKMPENMPQQREKSSQYQFRAHGRNSTHYSAGSENWTTTKNNNGPHTHTHIYISWNISMRKFGFFFGLVVVVAVCGVVVGEAPLLLDIRQHIHTESVHILSLLTDFRRIFSCAHSIAAEALLLAVVLLLR